MSILGPSGASFGLIGAAANSLRNPAAAERAPAENAANKLHAELARMANRDLDDSMETDLSHGQVSDRDGDGHLPWMFYGGQQDGSDQSEDKEAASKKKPALPDDPHHIDLTA